MFWVEASDSLNMKKSENSFLNELDMLLGIIVAAMGQIVYFWFGRENKLNSKSNLQTSDNYPIPNNESNIETVYAIDNSENSETSDGSKSITKAIEIPKATNLDKPFWFSVLFFIGYFILLFTLVYFQTAGAAMIQPGNDNLLDILIILLGVLTAGVAQILNYWFKKENKQEQDQNSAEILRKFINRERNSKTNYKQDQHILTSTAEIIKMEEKETKETTEPIINIENNPKVQVKQAKNTVNLSKNFISPHISYEEATQSPTASRNKIDNTPNQEQLENMKLVAAKCFEPVRNHFNTPIRINSFFRSAKLNAAVKGAKNSQHTTGQAIDISSTGTVTNKMIYDYIKNNLEYDQLIWEYGTEKNPQWVHVSYSKLGNRKQTLKIGVK
jgi:uncharacterized protein YcbK (DUF882 family)/protein-S-isoprenylcysteine O-methyltransferase Ste14